MLLLLPAVLDMNVAAATGSVVWGLFIAQQVLLLLRAAVTVGWFGSEAAFYLGKVDSARFFTSNLLPENAYRLAQVLAEDRSALAVVL